MNYQQILITGGAGFVGSNLALFLKQRYPQVRIIAADNLKRRGSETNIPRLQQQGIEFFHADIRNPEDLRFGNRQIDLILECSAEPSVLAGYGEAPDYLINTNLLGTVNCLEVARRCKADIVFLSSSRVYPIQTLNSVPTVESETRFEIAPNQTMQGISERGVAEDFPLEGTRSLYGATKLCSEMLIQEYGEMYGLRFIINRCGVLTGPWQMGKVDQGVFALWMAMHYFQRELSYIGWGGTGKQVRDLLHIDDLADLIDLQLNQFDKLDKQTFNVGGSVESSLSLLETTQLCQAITGNTIEVKSVPGNRPADLKFYITDNARITKATNWSPKRMPPETLQAIFDWIKTYENQVKHVWLG